jgi:hypothetical protein
MALVGPDFARSHMEDKGWVTGAGLGRHGQGITDAIKPKLKFDQAGVGHNRYHIGLSIFDNFITINNTFLKG